MECGDTPQIKPDVPTPLNLNPLGDGSLRIEFALYLSDPGTANSFSN